MARLIPNENTWIGFAAAGGVTNIQAPTAAQVAGAVELTDYCISLNASSRGNTVPTPSFDSLFETSTAGTSAATFDADFYRDDEDDLAWETLERGPVDSSSSAVSVEPALPTCRSLPMR